MRFRLALAFSVSILLIGVASWSRFTNVEKIQPSIVAIETNEGNYQDFLQDFLEPKTVGTTTPSEPLTNTDLIGRQLIMDYIGLAAGGDASTASIDALAERYVESIPTLNNALTISYIDLRVVSNTKVNFENYSTQLGNIYIKHSERINRAYAEVIGTDLNNAYYSAAKEAGMIYENTAMELKNLPVPVSVALSHLKLVNKHLSSAAALESISETEKDPMTAFAGLVAVNENLDEEIVILKQIGQLLKTNGI